MTEEHISNPDKGLPLGTKAPLIKKNDIFEKLVDLESLVKEHRGVILDFSRGAW